MKVINSILAALLISQAVCRCIYTIPDDSRGLVDSWATYTILLTILTILGEFRKPIRFIVNFPFLLTRTGRGVMFLLLTLPMFGTDGATIALGVFVILGAIFNIVLGWKDAPMSFEIVIDPSKLEHP
jgi:hypothetical protein